MKAPIAHRVESRQPGFDLETWNHTLSEIQDNIQADFEGFQYPWRQRQAPETLRLYTEPLNRSIAGLEAALAWPIGHNAGVRYVGELPSRGERLLNDLPDYFDRRFLVASDGAVTLEVIFPRDAVNYFHGGLELVKDEDSETYPLRPVMGVFAPRQQEIRELPDRWTFPLDRGGFEFVDLG